jgi:hypothetical protein
MTYWLFALMISCVSLEDKVFIIIIIITRRCNPFGFLPEVWSPLQATVHLCQCVGSFTCPGIDAQVQGTTVFSLIRHTLFVLTTYSSFCMCPGRDRTRLLTLLGL